MQDDDPGDSPAVRMTLAAFESVPLPETRIVTSMEMLRLANERGPASLAATAQGVDTCRLQVGPLDCSRAKPDYNPHNQQRSKRVSRPIIRFSPSL